MSGNGTGNQTVRVCKDRVDSPIQISEGFLRIIGPEQVAAHSMAVGAVNHLLCACGFIKLQLLAAVLNRPRHIPLFANDIRILFNFRLFILLDHLLCHLHGSLFIPFKPRIV